MKLRKGNFYIFSDCLHLGEKKEEVKLGGG
jgi:hypothetical protein